MSKPRGPTGRGKGNSYGDDGEIRIGALAKWFAAVD